MLGRGGRPAPSARAPAARDATRHMSSLRVCPARRSSHASSPHRPRNVPEPARSLSLGLWMSTSIQTPLTRTGSATPPHPSSQQAPVTRTRPTLIIHMLILNLVRTLACSPPPVRTRAIARPRGCPQQKLSDASCARPTCPARSCLSTDTFGSLVRTPTAFLHTAHQASAALTSSALENKASSRCREAVVQQT